MVVGCRFNFLGVMDHAAHGDVTLAKSGHYHENLAPFPMASSRLSVRPTT